MNEKTGPYGSHYGTGCYTPNCRLRGAAANGVVPPPSFEEANAALSAVYSRVLSSRGTSGEEAVKAARLAVNATDEGLKALRKSLVEEKKRSGVNSVAYLSLENDLQLAENEHDRKDAQFRKEVFDSISGPVTSADLKFLAAGTSRFNYSKRINALVSSFTPNTIFAQVEDDGSLFVKPVNKDRWMGAFGDSPYANMKKLISERVYEDALIDISNRPTSDTRISNAINGGYAGTTPKVNPDGSYSFILRSREKFTPLAQLEFSEKNEFKGASYASDRNDGSMTWPEASPIKFLSLLRSGDIKSKPVLPSYMVP